MVRISSCDDFIRDHDVIARIEELYDIATGTSFDADQRSTANKELAILQGLAEEVSACAAWGKGVTLIRDSYFPEYAEQHAEDLGLINGNVAWPCNCIDWDRAADQLKADYSDVFYEGVQYWING